MATYSATHLEKYSSLKLLISMLQIASAFGIAVFCMSKYDFAARVFYCSAATKRTALEVSIVSYFIVALEAVIILMFGCVYYLNVKRR